MAGLAPGAPGGPPLLVQGAYVLAEPGQVRADTAVLIRDGRVEAVDTRATLLARAPGAAVLGGPDRVVTPGLVNAHAHGKAVDGAARGVPDGPLEAWIHHLAGGPAVDAYTSTLCADAALLEAGVTTVLHHAYEPDPEGFARVFAAHRASGIRATVALGISDQNRLVHDGQAGLLDALPADVRPAAELLAGVKHGDGDAWLAFARAAARTEPGERLRLGLGPSGPQWCSDRLWRRVAETAGELGLPIHTHVAESRLERAHARRVYGRSAIAHLEGLGVLGPRTSLAHGVWIEPGDADRLAKHGTTLVHNPGSNLRLWNGIAPLRALHAAGVPLALGTDDSTLGRAHDLMGEARLAWRLHRPTDVREKALPAEAILAMVTTGGARAAGHGPGTLTPGAPADLVCWDLPAILAPLPGLPAGLVETLLARAEARHVDTVLVAGAVVVRGGRHVAPERDAWFAALTEDLRRAPRRPRLAAAAVLVWPHLQRFYAGWLEAESGA